MVGRITIKEFINEFIAYQRRPTWGKKVLKMIDDRQNQKPEDETREPGVYRDPTNGDIWELNDNHIWRWVNGSDWYFVPSGLVRVGDLRKEF